ncbi:sulfite exporter TauE/SafE family protein [Schinkia azotoformans]|uniref:Cytochrome c biogenesis protein transmembrane protein n=1 Tax=Schinkia azotoformans LMG 9581 TaxID=1131731 RepID=K6D5F9_SCHAZ|nr:sulfite exporter TauE/SafE family protein [Schinkia azotoformans]EKN63499.1 cytochrome c biogenesis protein transmembrane protein [Schinkia azotoformans LMG 9581]MEC1638797.1 sulfite exporter TauE/SafE family protein [Schinkia azotoformans]MEC1946762.1 sulfite exporter TauE/SafE family protein [Schinkia azotoformans]
MYEIFSQISNLLSQPFMRLAYGFEGTPILAALFLGVVGAVAPCQFTGNLGAITIYGNRSLQNKIPWLHIIWFTMGKMVVFSSLGLLVWLLGREFQDLLPLFFPWIRKTVGPFLILIGLFMIGIIKMTWFITLGEVPERLKEGKLGAFFLGVGFSLGFCPTMFLLFFVTLMPIVFSASYGVILPSVFAIGTSLPLIIAIFLIWYFGISGSNMKKKGRKVGAIIQKVSGWIMIVLGTLDTITYWF